MDTVHEIKLRLPIEQLVSQYVQVIKKGHQLKCICPFHNDKHPSMLISPDKGIAYCFACNSGGDIFSFYQKIEGVDFTQAVKDLAEKTGVTVEGPVGPSVSKDEKTRIKQCITAAHAFFIQALQASTKATDYLVKRGIDSTVSKQFGLAYAPDSGTALHDHLLKQGFSQTEILKAGLASERELNGTLFDRFRDRLLFPIYDPKGEVIAFGGRTLGDDKAKYINSPEGLLYNKSQVLYGYNFAKDAIRDSASVILVEGYFDVLACFRAGLHNAVAVSGTALTEQHVTLLKRFVKKVILCLDQDEAGKKAALRAFELCSKEEIDVYYATINGKDPDEALQASREDFIQAVTQNTLPYIDANLSRFTKESITSIEQKKLCLQTILPLVRMLPSAVERSHYIEKLAKLLGTSVANIEADLHSHSQTSFHQFTATPEKSTPTEFTAVDLALGAFLLFPKYKHLLKQLIVPDAELERSIYNAIESVSDFTQIADLPLADKAKERANIIALYCESLDWLTWSELLVSINIKKQCQFANQYIVKRKIAESNAALVSAEQAGKEEDVRNVQATLHKELQLRRFSEGS
jgi:DNA primase